MSPMELQDVSPDQDEANKAHRERKRWARARSFVASRLPNALVESRTVRDPLVPQPEPDADPLQPLISRPSRSRTDENILEKVSVGETRTGSPEAPRTHRKSEKDEAPQPGPQVVDVQQATEDAEEAEHKKRVKAGQKAAATRAKNEESQKRSAAAKRAANTRAANEKKAK